MITILARWRALVLAVAVVVSALSMTAEPAWADTTTSIAEKFRDTMLDGCWSCDLFTWTSDLGLTMAEKIYAEMVGPLKSLFAILMGLWILAFVARVFLPFGPERGLWNKGAKKMMVFAVILGMLNNSSAFWDYLFYPILATGMGVANTILTVGDGLSSAPPDEATGIISEACSGPESDSGPISGINSAKLALQQLACPIARIQNVFGKEVVIGVALIGGAFKTDSWFPSANEIGQAFLDVISGLGLAFMGIMAILIYPIYFIDALFRALVVAMLAPILVGAYAFEPLKRLATRGLVNLGQAAFTVIIMGVVVSLGKAVMYKMLGAVSENNLRWDTWDNVISSIDAARSSSGDTWDMTVFDANYWALIGTSFVMLQMARRASSIAAEFVGGPGGDFTGAESGVLDGVTRAGQAVEKVAEKITGADKKKNVSGGGGGGGSRASQVVGSQSSQSAR